MSNGLGRGLSSLIPQKVKKVATSSGEAVVDIASNNDRGKILDIALEKIKVNPLQPRRNFAEKEMQELVDSIKKYGIIQPLIVTEKDGGYYELIVGERRLRAAKLLNLASVPALVRMAREQEKLEMALIENLQREDLNPIEMALAYRKLVDEFNLTQEEVSLQVGKSRSSVANILRLLNLPEEIQEALMEGKISEGHAKLLSGLEGETKQFTLFRRIIHNGLTTEETIKELRRMGGTKQARIKINYADKDKEFAFREFFGTKAEVKRKGKGGLVIINFYSDEELNEMVAKIRK